MSDYSAIEKKLQCPSCRAKLRKQEEIYHCSMCKNRFPIIDGIFDFLPRQTPYAPEQIAIEEKYEEYGTGTSRSDTFQNNLRKKITLRMVEGNDILEIGAAEGWLTEKLTAKAKNVVSSDIALSYLKRAKSRGLDAYFFRLDAHSLPFSNNSYDCVIMTEVLEHLFSPYRALEEIHRVLSPDGHLILSTPNNMTFSNLLQHLFNRSKFEKEAHLNFYDVLSLKKLLYFTGFSIIEVKTVYIHIPLFKPLFNSEFVQRAAQIFFKNFGAKILIKAAKMTTSLWDSMS